MTDFTPIIHAAGIACVIAPAALLAALLPGAAARTTPNERRITAASVSAAWLGFAAAATALGLLLVTGTRRESVNLFAWEPGMGMGFRVCLGILLDRLSLGFMTMAFLLAAIVATFSGRYMHRDPGYRRFFILYALFLAGLALAALAGTIETLFAGWELVGVASALLIGFFQHREGPIRNALGVWTVYRAGDAVFMLACVILHTAAGHGVLTHQLTNPGHGLTTAEFAAGACLIIAAAAKSSLLPLGPWLPRALEGPTPTSAIFYGALSLHLGPYLLLRTAPIIHASPTLETAVIVIGIVSCLVATLIVQVQTDVKSMIAYACIAQVGLIFIEIGLGLHALAAVHLAGHAVYRTFQLLRAPSYLRDHRAIENRLGAPRPGPGPSELDHLSDATRLRLWRFAQHLSDADGWLRRLITGPIRAGVQRLEGRMDHLPGLPDDALCPGMLPRRPARPQHGANP